MIERIEQKGGYYLYRPTINPAKCRPETPEQIDFVAWVRYNHPEHADMMIHVANEGDQTPQYRQQLYRMGLLKGASDLLFFIGPGCAIEMKQCKWAAATRPEQKEFLGRWTESGKFGAVCHGVEAAKFAFIDYLYLDWNHPKV